jgi:hypothetical protein
MLRSNRMRNHKPGDSWALKDVKRQIVEDAFELSCQAFLTCSILQCYNYYSLAILWFYGSQQQGCLDKNSERERQWPYRLVQRQEWRRSARCVVVFSPWSITRFTGVILGGIFTVRSLVAADTTFVCLRLIVSYNLFSTHDKPYISCSLFSPR